MEQGQCSALIYNQSAQDLSGAMWGHELAHALMACEKQFAQLQEPGGDPAQQSLILDMIRKLKGAMQDVWKVSSVDVFTVGYESFRVPDLCPDLLQIGE
jgi:hypothetical protein